MIERWNKEIDTLLVYAGLFSAILTAFNVWQSYPLLTPAPLDPVLAALQQISSQLNSSSVTSSFVNATHPAVNLQPLPAPPPDQWAIWLNALWFASLIFSLAAASVGIMVKQWLNQYSSGLSGSSQQIARLRQHRLNGLQKWCVGAIVAMLPVLLQAGAVLFFAGLLILLWSLNHLVAIIASTLVGALATFLIVTVVIPAFTTDCPYLSPVSFAICKALQPLFLILWHRCLQWFSSSLRAFLNQFLLYAYSSHNRRRYLLLIAKILDEVFRSPGIPLSLPPRDRELLSVTRHQNRLDGDMVASAYTVVMDVK